MSVSPSFPHGAPSLAEVVRERTFAKPTNPFVDGEFLDALEHADDGKPAVKDAFAAAPAPTATADAPAPAAAPAPASPAPAALPATSSSTIDVRV